MFIDSHEITFSAAANSDPNWQDIMLTGHGMHCRFDPQRPAHSTVRGWSLGSVEMVRADLAVRELMPPAKGHPAWQGEWMYIKLVTAGYVDVEQFGQTRRFRAGSIFVLDPARPFVESFPARAQMIVLRIRKATLRERGLSQAVDGLVVPDMGAADMRATRDLIHCIARQFDAPSRSIRERMGEQVLELIDAILASTGTAARRSAQALVSAAKRYIRGHLGDHDLDASAIAASVNVSVKHLHRLFQPHGTSLMRYVWQARLEHAARLLHASGPGRISMQEIAWQCGFSTAAHFSRAFRSRYGLSPAAFRAARAAEPATPDGPAGMAF
jgi:AraC-like DNA-binding protein